MDAGQTKARPIIAWVDDDVDFQAAVRHWVAPTYDLVSYRDGEDFLAELDEMEPDVIMLDVRLPGPDGFKLCRAIRAHPRLADVPILFLTCSRDDEDYVRYLDVGGTAYLGKPVDRRRLLSTLRGLIAGRATEPAGMIQCGLQPVDPR